MPGQHWDLARYERIVKVFNIVPEQSYDQKNIKTNKNKKDSKETKSKANKIH